MVTYSVERIDDLMIKPGSPVDAMDLMSPFVWRENGCYRMLVRAVPRPLGPNDPTGVIAAATSTDGLSFHVDPPLAIVPGGDPSDVDAGGCEDPTVLSSDERYVVYYTGVEQSRQQGAMVVATGTDLHHLEKRKIVLQAPQGQGNIKEATLVQCPAGDWRLFYEYAQDNASRVGMAKAETLDGPWVATHDPFTIRNDSWDDWHLSTGPIITIDGGDPVMFYNGATKDARWRIGWISFDPTFEQVTGRGIEPVVMPPPPRDRSATDIAFAASTVVEDGLISLYYSVEDRELRRARVRRYA